VLVIAFFHRPHGLPRSGGDCRGCADAAEVARRWSKLMTEIMLRDASARTSLMYAGKIRGALY
jgi:hypothetical protein